MATPYERGSDALLQRDGQTAVDTFTEVILERSEKALNDFYAVIRLEPKEQVACLNRTHLYERANQPDKASADFTKALELKPTAITYAMRGTVHQKAKDYAKAREDYRTALKLNPNELTALNNFACLQAACPDADFRDGKSAVEHATRACQMTQWRVHGYFSTLTAAYAEAGDFQKALTLAEQIKDEHLESYQAGKPVGNTWSLPHSRNPFACSVRNSAFASGWSFNITNEPERQLFDDRTHYQALSEMQKQV